MYNQCCVPGCDSSTRYKMENMSFHSFPKLDRFIFVKTSLGNIKKISARKLWAKRLRLPADIANSWRVCSKHFKADDYLSSSIDKKVKRLKNIAIPSVDLPEPSAAKKVPLAKQKKNEARAARAEARLSRVTPAILKKTQSQIEYIKETTDEKEDLHNSDSEVNALFEEWIPDNEETYDVQNSVTNEISQDHMDQIELISVGTQTECTCSENNTKNLTFQVKAAQLLVEMNEILGDCMKDKDVDNYMHNVILKVTEEFYSASRRYYKIVIFNLIKNDAQLRAFTGIGFDILGALAKSLVIDESERFPRIEISVEARIVLCLIKMKLNLSFKTLSYLFYITEQECRTTFLSSITALKNVLKAAIFWPTINNVSESLENFNDICKPTNAMDNIELLVQVKPLCPNCDKLVPDSSIKKGNSLVGYSQAYGSLKKMKILLGFSTSGLIRYVGKVFTGKAGGTVITDQNQISKLLTVQKNAIMQNGILIIKNSTNNFLNFLTSKKDIKFLSENEVNSKNKKNSKKVEKPLNIAFKKFKQFKIFQNEIPSEIVPYIDDISVIICGVINLSNSVIVDKTKIAQVG